MEPSLHFTLSRRSQRWNTNSAKEQKKNASDDGAPCPHGGDELEANRGEGEGVDHGGERKIEVSGAALTGTFLDFSPRGGAGAGGLFLHVIRRLTFDRMRAPLYEMDQ